MHMTNLTEDMHAGTPSTLRILSGLQCSHRVQAAHGDLRPLLPAPAAGASPAAAATPCMVRICSLTTCRLSPLTALHLACHPSPSKSYYTELLVPSTLKPTQF